MIGLIFTSLILFSRVIKAGQKIKIKKCFLYVSIKKAEMINENKNMYAINEMN